MLGTTVKGWPLGDIFLCHLILPGFSLRLKPVLIRFALAPPSFFRSSSLESDLDTNRGSGFLSFDSRSSLG
jgi:hypothetical protein